MAKYYSLFNLFLCILLLAACSAQIEDKDKIPVFLEKASFTDLKGWEQEDFIDVQSAFLKSCSVFAKRSENSQMTLGAYTVSFGVLQNLCEDVEQISNQAELSQFFEKHFQPYLVRFDGVGGNAGETGLFTGYYEPVLYGSKTRTGAYKYPLRARPDDLVMVDLGAFREDLKGRRIAGRVQSGRLQPYESRPDIIAGKLPPAQDKPIVWVNDPVDAFFLHIQGSGRVILDDGSEMRVGYAGQNGHPYYAIGRELIKREEIAKDNVSLQSIRAWLSAHPDQAEEIMNTNASYVFFRVLEEDGPVGGQGITLTPERSLAVDHTKIPYGLPLWVDIEAVKNEYDPIRRLMIAQDTGGAIRGAVRGDVFWGHGEKAEYMAGHMKSQGRYWVLLPKTE